MTSNHRCVTVPRFDVCHGQVIDSGERKSLRLLIDLALAGQSIKLVFDYLLLVDDSDGQTLEDVKSCLRVSMRLLFINVDQLVATEEEL